MLPSTPKTVAVIGAGAAGLIAAHELRQEGHKVVVFEKENQLGGTWAYTPSTESDPIGMDPSRNIIHSSLYASLRTNLPREVMGFRAYPFVSKPGNDNRDSRRFPGHREVLEYLKDFSMDFGIFELVRFGTEVSRVGLSEIGKWEVRSKRKMGNFDEVYDAVVVCNGHYTEPRIAEIPGIERWPGKQIHSHNYRVPEPFEGQVVVLIGSAASADDISREMAKAAKEVHIASRSAPKDTLGKLPGYNNIWLHSMIQSVHEDGSVIFQDGHKIIVDIILHCTGYKYHFPFLDTNGTVTVDDNCVGPLYQHIFPPSLAPSLSFVGLPWKVVPFPLCEYQSKWIAGVLSGRLSIPSKNEMLDNVEEFYSSLKAAGIPQRYTHNMATYQISRRFWSKNRLSQGQVLTMHLGEVGSEADNRLLVGSGVRTNFPKFEYDDWLAAACGCDPTEEWRKSMYDESSKRKRSQSETYRDVWDDEGLIAQAQVDFLNYLSDVHN